MGEGGPELVKQLLSQTYDINMPGVIGIYMTGAPAKGSWTSGRCSCNYW